MDDLPDIVCQQGKHLSGFAVLAVVEQFHGLGKALGGVLMQVADGNAAGQQGVIRMTDGQGCRRFCSKVIEFRGGDPVIEAFYHFFGHVDGIHKTPVKAITEFFNAGGDFVEFNALFFLVSFNDEHLCYVFILFFGLFVCCIFPGYPELEILFQAESLRFLAARHNP